MRGASAAIAASRRRIQQAASAASSPAEAARRISIGLQRGAPQSESQRRRGRGGRFQLAHEAAPPPIASRRMSSTARGEQGGDAACNGGRGGRGAAEGEQQASRRPPREEAKRVILEAAKTLQLLAGRMGDSFDRAVDMIEGMPPGGRVVLTGVGKSGHVARKVAASMSSTGTCAFFMHATEALHGDLGSVRQGDVCIAISYSGETPETLAALRGFKKLSAGSIAITSDPESTLGRQCDVCLAMGSITELDHNKLAPTASTVAAMSLGDALTVVVSNRRHFTRSDFELYHPGGQLGLQNRMVMRAAERLTTCDDGVVGTQAADEVEAARGGKLSSSK